MIRTGAASMCSLLHAQRRVACSAHAGIRRVSNVTGDGKKLLQSVSLENLAHQSRVYVLVPDATHTRIRIAPTLQQSEFALNVFGNTTKDSFNGEIFTIQEELTEDGGAQANVLRLSKLSTDVDPTEMDVQLHLPHLVDLDIMAVNGSVVLSDKFEGNVRVSLSDGNIFIDKVRGEQIELKTNRGRIDVSSLVEGGKVKMAASAVNIKRLMSGSTEVKLAKGTEDSEFGSIYASLCLVNSQSSGGLTVGNIHGFLRVSGESMKAIHVHSVNGALHVEDSGSNCNVDAHFDVWSSDAANKIFVGGDVRVSLDPSAPIDVELHGSKIMTNGCTFNESELDQLDEDYAIFTGSLEAQAATVSASSASGKINVGNAKNSALRTSFFAVDKDNSEDGASAASSDIHPARLPRLVVHTSSGSVKLEQLDWMGKIKRKHLSQ